MKKLTNLKRDNGFTLIVLAHTPKRLKWQPIELMDLAGSALIGNFIDACFTINYSTFEGDKNSRYIKQLKCRFSEMVYHSENVETVKLARVKENFTGIEVCVPDELPNVVIAIVFPPFSILWNYHLGIYDLWTTIKKFIICLFLTFLFYFPGLIYAINELSCRAQAKVREEKYKDLILN